MTGSFLPAPPLPPGRPNLVVTGFMGTGKTTAGRLAAQHLGLPFVDLDEVIERRAGRAVDAIFATAGEAGFRRLEREAVLDAARLSGAVVATGGGSVLDARAFGALGEGAVVAVLSAEPEAILARLSRDGVVRPLLGSGVSALGRVRDLLAERAEAYLRAGQLLDTTGLGGPEGVAEELVRRYLAHAAAGETTTVEVAVLDGGGGSSYAVRIGRGALASMGAELSRIAEPEARVVVVVDERLEDTVALSAVRSLEEAGRIVLGSFAVPSGEAAKDAATLAGLWTGFRRCGLGPRDVVVAVGGGATLDVAGFAAATFGRGTALVNVPTTLLAMVDASLGGKTAIDHAGVKNLVGAFHHPRLVVADPAVLETLPPRMLAAGMAEVVKAFVLASPLALEWLEAESVESGGKPVAPARLPWLVEQAVRIKAAYVGADPLDRGLRHSLNLGHTFAHALESATGHAMAHGEAVAGGRVAAARLGADLGVTPPGLAPRLGALLAALRLPVAPPAGLDPGRVLDAMGGDKKRRGGELTFVLPAPGGAELHTGVDPRAAVEALLQPQREGALG